MQRLLRAIKEQGAKDLENVAFSPPERSPLGDGFLAVVGGGWCWVAAARTPGR